VLGLPDASAVVPVVPYALIAASAAVAAPLPAVHAAALHKIRPLAVWAAPDALHMNGPESLARAEAAIYSHAAVAAPVAPRALADAAAATPARAFAS